MDTPINSNTSAVALSAATAGAQVVSSYFQNLSTAGAQNKISSSESGSDGEYRGIVTQADIEAEHAIVAEIKKSFPDHQFLAEEEHSAAADSEHLWIIDPLDGTNNFAHGIPHFAVSVAYYHNGVAECGVILDPSRDDRFTAEKGRGAYWNGNRVSVNQHASFEETMIAVGFYYDRGPMMKATLNAIEELFQQNIHGIRRFGTAALDLVQVGLGRFGAFFEYELSPWDFAAARLFVEEAGGKVTDCCGGELPIKKTSLLATNGQLHDSMLGIVRKHANYTTKNS